MKLLPKKTKTQIKLTSVDNETKVFESLTAAALFLEVTPAAVHQAIRNNWKCRGCKIQRIETT